MHLLFGVLLEVELLLKLIEFSPELTLILLNISPVALKVLDLSNLFLLFSLNSLQLVVKLCELLLQSLPLFGFLWTLIPFQLSGLQLEILFKLAQLAAVIDPLLLFLLYLFVQMIEHLVKASEAYWILDLETTLFRYVALDKISD